MAYQWFDFEPDDNDNIPEKHYLTIADSEGEEIAIIVHREAGGRFPLNGDVAESKRQIAQLIVESLNAFEQGRI